MAAAAIQVHQADEVLGPLTACCCWTHPGRPTVAPPSWLQGGCRRGHLPVLWLPTTAAWYGSVLLLNHSQDRAVALLGL